jgi:exosortase D (VPLPA-CTERM-specific)
MAEGFLHEFQGWLVFMASAGLMLGEIVLLNRVGHESGDWRQMFGMELPAPTPAGAPRRQRRIPRSFVAACLLLAALTVMGWVIPRPAEISPQRSTFIDYPMQLGPWRGQHEALESNYLDALKLDDYLLADYTASGSAAVNVYIAYYDSQRKGEAVHSPRACLPGGGWQLSEFDQRTLKDVKIGSQALRVNRTLITLGDRRQLVYYWFQQRGRVITNEFAVKFYLFEDAVTRHRTDGALVRLITEVPLGSSEADADRRLSDIARRMTPTLTRFVPD